MKEKIKVLDHGFVRLADWVGNDLSITRNARVSYDADWRAGEDEGSDSRLIEYLYEIRVYTKAILELLEPIVPVAVSAFKEFTLNEK